MDRFHKNEVWREWYARNRERQYAKIKKNFAKRKLELRILILGLKQKSSCIRCGFSDFRALQFHHRGSKEVNIAEAPAKGWGKKRILKEIEKCEILCANCHSIEHFQGVGKPANPLGLEPRDRRLKSSRPDQVFVV